MTRVNQRFTEDEIASFHKRIEYSNALHEFRNKPYEEESEMVTLDADELMRQEIINTYFDKEL